MRPSSTSFSALQLDGHEPHASKLTASGVGPHASKLTTSGVGTLRYAAPEVVQRGGAGRSEQEVRFRYNQACDVYSFGRAARLKTSGPRRPVCSVASPRLIAARGFACGPLAS